MTRADEAYVRLEDGASDVDGQPMAGQQQPRPISQPTAVIPSSKAAKSRERYKNRIFALGIAECSLGGLSIIFAIATIFLDNDRISNYSTLTYTGQGVWAGAFIFITGILGVSIRKNPSICMYNSNMSLSIITAVFTGVALLLSIFASITSMDNNTVHALHIIITLCLFGGFVSTIVHSGFSCGGVCGRRYGHPGTIVYIPQVPLHQQIGGIPSVQYVVPAGANITPQGYYVMPRTTVNTNIATIPPQQIVGQQMVTNIQTVALASDAVAAPTTVVDSPPGYSTLPKQ